MAKEYSLAVYDLNGTRLCTLYDSKINQVGSVYNIKISKEIDGWKEVQFEISKFINGEYNFRCDYLKNEHLLYLFEDENIDVYCIKEPVGLHEKSKMQYSVLCNHISEELKTKNLYRYFDDSNGIGTCEELIQKAIRGTGWTLVACDKFFENTDVAEEQKEKIRSYSCETKTGSYNMISGICKLFNARPVYKYDGTNRTIEIYAKTNTNGWMEALFGKNIDKIKRKSGSSNIITRLYVEGEYGDHGYVGIDNENPDGLPFILNFDYYKELGLFTDKHQTAVDKYIEDYKKVSMAITSSTGTMLEYQTELNNLIGSFGYAYYPISGGEISQDTVILGNGMTIEEAEPVESDNISVVQRDGSHEYKVYPFEVGNEMCWIKFNPTITGMIAAYEDKIKASQRALESYIEKLNKYLRTNDYAEVTISKLKKVYGTNDLSIVKDDGYNLAEVNEPYTHSTVLDYAVSIGKEEKEIADNKAKMRESMLRAIELIQSIEVIRAAILHNGEMQDEIEDVFSVAMGSLLKDGYWSDDNYTVGQESALYKDALEISKKMAYPIISYENIGIQDLSISDKYAGEEFELGQAIRIYDKDFKINDSGVVSKTVECPDKRESNTISIHTDMLDIGNKSFASILERVTEMAEQVRRNREIYERAIAISKNGTFNSEMLQGAIDVMKTKLTSTSSNWYTDEKGNIIFLSLDGRSVMMLCGNGFMIANDKLENGEWNWRTFGTGEGFSADLIVAGFLSAERIQANTITANHLTSDVGESLDLSSNTSIDLRVANIVSEEADNKIIAISDDEPINPKDGDVWLDTNGEQNVFKKWIATENQWVAISESDLNIGSRTYLAEANLKIESDSIRASVASVKEDLQNEFNTTKEYVEAELSADKIMTKVTSQDTWKTMESNVSQTADKISWMVKSDESSSEMSITDDAISAISEKIEIDATQVTINVSDGQKKSIEDKMADVEQSISNVSKDANDKINEVQATLTPGGIYTLVSQTDEYKGLEDDIGEIESQIQQNADRIGMIVSSKDASSGLELTDAAISIISGTWKPTTDDLSGKINNTNERLESAEDRLTSAEMKIQPDAIEMIVSNKIVDIESGRQNLFKRTRDFGGGNDDNPWTNTLPIWEKTGETHMGLTVARSSEEYLGLTQKVNLKKNETYTLSAWIKCDEGADIMFYCTNTNRNGTRLTDQVGQEWRRIHQTFEMSDSVESVPRFENQIKGKMMYICGLKLEHNNIPTDWCDSPDDIDEELDYINVGGRNYILETSEPHTATSASTEEMWDWPYWCASPESALSLYGKTVAISFDYDADITDGYVALMYHRWYQELRRFTVDDNIGHVEIVIDVIDLENIDEEYRDIDSAAILYFTGEWTGQLTVSNLKLELGTRHTDWTPAPEDTDEIIANVGNTASDAMDIGKSAMEIANSALTRDEFQRIVRTDIEGLHVGDNTTNYEVLIDSASVNIVANDVRVSTFSDKFIRLDNMQIRKVTGGLTISVYKG